MRILLLLFLPFGLLAQPVAPPDWSFAFSTERATVGDTVDLVFTADIPAEWYLYSSDFDPDLGPIVTTFAFEPHPSYALVGALRAIKPKKKYDDIWEGEYTYFVGRGEFRQRVKLLNPDPQVAGTVEYQICTDADGRCVNFDEEFTLTGLAVRPAPQQVPAAVPPAPRPKPDGDARQSAPAATESAAAPRKAPNSRGATPTTTSEKKPSRSATELNGTASAGAPDAAESSAKGTPQTVVLPSTVAVVPPATSLWGFALAAFGAGLLALLTPCVFPMIPMTVTFFTRSEGSSRGRGLRDALIYGLSIVLIFTLIGTVVSRLNGPAFANFLSTHWLPNVFFFAVFIFFAISFFGAFELTLPSSWVNMADRQSDKGGLGGVFFMAFTLVLVSFSCTGPIVGSVLVASAGGAVMKPIAGMVGFSLAFALPFALFALFPQWLNSLPKSGGWLNVVKVTLGFLELAFAFKFLSVADQAYHWNLLDRDVYLAIWIAVFTGLALYLFGVFRLPHDSPTERIGVPRLLFALLTLTFVVYLLPGLVGAPLRPLAGYLPPQSTLDFDATRNYGQLARGIAPTAPAGCPEPKHADFLELPHGLYGYFDYQQALACARAQNKPIFVDFTGHGCVNCREMEARVWSDPRVLRLLREEYVVLALYVDDKTELPEAAWYTSEYDGKVKKTIGKQNADLQISRFQNNAQPFYVLLSPDGALLHAPKAYDLSVDRFVAFLRAGLATYTALPDAPESVSYKD